MRHPVARIRLRKKRSVPFAVASLAFVLAAGLFAAGKESFASGSKNIECQVGEMTERGSSLRVPVTISQGAQIVALQPVLFKGKTFSARWIKESKFEKQSAFIMTFGDESSTLYDFSPEGHTGPINAIEKGDVRFQCWVSNP